MVKKNRSSPLLIQLLTLVFLSIIVVVGRGESFELIPCPPQDDGTQYLCGTLEVFEDRLKKRGRKIPLKVVVLPTQPEGLSDRALFLLAGGPGVAATRWGPGFVAHALGALRRTHDIVFVDQRGTGGSNPLQCRLFEPGDVEALWGDLLPIRPIRRCRRELEKGSDLSLYGTALAMGDLEEVRATLGYERVDLYGSSYGTHAALVYLRRFPQRVRSVVLQGVAPPSARGLEEIPGIAQDSLDRLLTHCEADEACRGAYPELRMELAGMFKRLRTGPLRVEVSAPSRGERVTLDLTYDNFALVLRGLLHHAPAAARIPFIVHAAVRGDFEPFAVASFNYRGAIAHNLEIGMFLSVFCEEQVRQADRAVAAKAAESSFVGDYWTAQLTRACGVWPRGRLPADHGEPVRSEIPVLLVSGGLDPATPPRWAREAAAHLPNSLLLEMPYVSHSLGQSEGCASQIAVAFLQQGSANGLDTSCVENLTLAPFAVP